jgi:23S rRNA G2445 N2-methylase RlmL
MPRQNRPRDLEGKRSRADVERGEAIHATPGTFLLHTQPGLEAVAERELSAVAQGLRLLGRRTVPGRNSVILFAATESPHWSRLRTAEDVFSLVAYRRVRDPRQTLDQTRAAARLTPLMADALRERALLQRASKGKRTLDFRVVTRVAGEHPFRRSELGRAVERGVLERADHRWRLADEQGDAVEIWATLIDQELFLALRLSDRYQRHREYQLSHRPASLRPSVAAALAWLSQPRPHDIVMDPLCGTGTILVERAHLAPHKLLLGADISAHAVDATRTNLGSRHKPWQLVQWDAGALPLRDHCVDKLITNLPWGKKLGDREQNRALYPRLFAEFARVVKPDGLLVILTGETRLMARLIDRMKFRRLRSFPVHILGARAGVYVLHPRAALGGESPFRER